MPDEHHLRISDLITLLEGIEERKGDLPCYVYSVEEKRPRPMTESCLTRDPKNFLCFSAILEWVEEELNNQIAEENKKLRSLMGDLQLAVVQEHSYARLFALTEMALIEERTS